MSIFREFNISMIPGKPPLIIHVSQYESDFVYTFNLISGKSVLAIPDTAIAVIRGTKRDGNGFSKEASLDTENNKVVVIGEVQMTACAGRNVFELAILNDEKTICTANFFLDVERAPLDAGTIQSESILRELQAIIDSAATATQAAQEASASAESAASAAEQAVEEKFEDGVAETIDEWLTNHPEATTTVQDGSLTLAKFARVENPDNYTGTDAEKLASAINAMPTGGIILLDRNYELTSNVIITRGSGTGRVIVKSINKNATINCNSYEFTSEGETFGSYGGIIFDGIRFVGTGNLIDGKYLIRIFFCNCYITGFNHVVYSSATENVYLQTIYFINCMIRQIKNYILDISADSGLHWLYDIRVNNSVIEWSYGFINARAWQGVYIDNNAIEGFTGNVPVFDDIKVSYASSISNNYFERNAGTTIDFSKATERNDITIDVSNNLFMQDTQTEGAIIILPMLNTGGCINIQDNQFRLANPTNAYGIKVMDEVTEVLSNCNITGNVATLYDPNNKIKNVKSLSKLYAEELYKISNVVDQSVDAIHYISVPVIGVALNSSLLRTAVPFPFGTKNIDYLIDIITLDFTNLGNVASNTEVYAKKTGGIITSTTGSFTQNTVYNGVANIRITFK